MKAFLLKQKEKKKQKNNIIKSRKNTGSCLNHVFHCAVEAGLEVVPQREFMFLEHL